MPGRVPVRAASATLTCGLSLLLAAAFLATLLVRVLGEQSGRDLLLGQLGELLVQVLAVLQLLFHRTYRDLVAGGFRQRSGGTPGRDAVVLDLLDAGNEYRVQRRPFLDLSNMLLRGLDEALGCGVFLLRHILFELAESRLELAQESLTMLRAQLDQLPELLRLNRFRKGRQNARQVAFRTLNLLQLECK